MQTMPAAKIIHVLKSSGFTIELKGQIILVGPSNRLTDDIRALVRANKPALLQALADQDASKPDAMQEQQAAGMAQAVIRRASALPEAKPLPWYHAAADWRPLAAAYHQHHFGCKQCIGAGQGRGLRCDTGTALWAAYDGHPAFD